MSDDNNDYYDDDNVVVVVVFMLVRKHVSKIFDTKTKTHSLSLTTHEYWSSRVNKK